MSEFINNHSLRKEKLKEALRQIHEGKPYQEVKEVFKEILSSATAGEIAEIEQALIAEGLPVEDIQYLCDGHVIRKTPYLWHIAYLFTVLPVACDILFIKGDEATVRHYHAQEAFNKSRFAGTVRPDE